MTNTALTNPALTNTDRHTASVQRLYAAYRDRDLDAVLAELADDVDWAAEAAGTAVPWYGPFRGKEQVPGFFAAIGKNVDVTEFELVGIAANETDVYATIHWTYTVPATGRSASMYMQHWWRFADGKIVFFRGSEDSGQSIAAFA
ncbi:MAG: nuclear transport factor 2 family protein [Pseudonocardia sp.]